MSTEVQPKTGGLMRVARHPIVRAVAKCALMCVLGASSLPRRSAKQDNKCCP